MIPRKVWHVIKQKVKKKLGKYVFLWCLVGHKKFKLQGWDYFVLLLKLLFVLFLFSENKIWRQAQTIYVLNLIMIKLSIQSGDHLIITVVWAWMQTTYRSKHEKMLLFNVKKNYVTIQYSSHTNVFFGFFSIRGWSYRYYFSLLSSWADWKINKLAQMSNSFQIRSCFQSFLKLPIRTLTIDIWFKKKLVCFLNRFEVLLMTYLQKRSKYWLWELLNMVNYYYIKLNQ